MEFRRKGSREMQELEFQKHFLVLTMNLIWYGEHINTYVSTGFEIILRENYN